MCPEKQKRLEAAGWVVGDIKDLLRLTPEEVEEVDRRIELIKNGRKNNWAVGVHYEIYLLGLFLIKTTPSFPCITPDDFQLVKDLSRWAVSRPARWVCSYRAVYEDDS